jgi:hypothetical protein
MKKILFGVFISAFLIACSNETKEETKPAATESAPASDTKKTGDEILAMSEADEAKGILLAFSKGDVNGMTAAFDENARVYWAGGDSIIGKKAVQDYWNGRMKLIETLQVVDQVLLPVKVNTSQAPQHALGKWVLVWTNVSVKYKNGKSLNFWTHSDYHYNSAGKIDVGIHYMDRHPIMEATKDMMPK